MTPQYHQDFIEAYGQEIFDSISAAVEANDLPRVAASLVYLVEMCEEVLFHNTKFDLIGTRLYGFTHNREQNSLNMNYLLYHEVAGQLDYRTMASALSRFMAHDFNSSTFRDLHIQPLQSVIPVLFNVFFEEVRVLEVPHRDSRGPLTVAEEVELLDQHNKMVQAHLNYRVSHPGIPITSYPSMEDALESKRILTYQSLNEDAQAVYAAFVYLNAQGDKYTHADIERLTGLNRGTVRSTTQYLTDRRFIVRNPSQRYHTTDITFDYLTVEEASNVLNTYLYRNGDYENLSWMETAILSTLVTTEEVGTPIQTNLSVLTRRATNGNWAKSNGDVSSAVSSLVMRGVIEKDISSKPYTYTVLVSDLSEDTVLRNVKEEDRSELESLGYRLPEAVSQDAPVSQTVDAGKVTLKPVSQLTEDMAADTGSKEVTLLSVLRDTIQGLFSGQRSVTIPECTMTLDAEEGVTIRFTPSKD